MRWLCVLVLLAALPVGPANAAEPPIAVTWDGARVSIEARDVPLLDVLRAVGARVGFRVAAPGPVERRVTLSVDRSTVEDALRRLLKTENHTRLYRDDGGRPVIDTIVVFAPGRGPAGPPDVAAAGVPGLPSSPVTGVPGAPAGPATAATPPTYPGSPAPSMPGAPVAAGTAPGAADPGALAALPGGGEPGVPVSELLRTHAQPGSPPADAPGAPAAAQPTPAPSGGTASPELSEDLAAATRMAQRNLKTLMEGLEAAGRSLSGAPAGQ